MPIISRLTPTCFHKFYNKLRGRKTIDTFPVAYRLNSSVATKKYAKEAGFSLMQIQLIEGRPEYLRLTTITYLFGFLYERIVNSTALFRPFRCVMIAELRKPS